MPRRRFETRRDAAVGRTTLRYSVDVPAFFSNLAFTRVIEQRPGAPRSEVVFAELVFSGLGPRLRNHHEAEFEIDTTAFHSTETTWHGRSADRSSPEKVVFPVDAAVRAALRSARKVLVRVGPYKIELSPEDRAGVRRFLRAK